MQAGSIGILGSFFPFILIFVVFYFLLFLPQQKKIKQHQKMLAELQKGDTVVTNGGIHGTVVAIKGNVVDLKVADEVKISFSKEAIAQVVKT